MGNPVVTELARRCGPRHPRHATHTALVVLLTLLTAVACTSNTAEVADPDRPETPSESATEPTEADTETEAETETDTETQPEPEPEPGDALEDQIGEVWTAFHTAWTDQAPTETPDAAAFDGVALDPTGAVEQLTAQRGDARTVTTEAELWPTITLDGPETATITDCVIVTQHPDGQPDSVATVTIAWQATATATDDGWRIDSAQPTGLFCIAEELNQQLLDAYEGWLEAHEEWSDPPDPEHPLLAQTMAEPGLTDMRSFLADELDQGVVSRFPHDPNGVVTDIEIAAARVTDCYEAPDDYGVFDLQTGERRPDLVPAPEPGQLNRTIADLERDNDGDWKVVGWRWEERNDCEPGETRYEVG
jgi:hypothetical protein